MSEYNEPDSQVIAGYLASLADKYNRYAETERIPGVRTVFSAFSALLNREALKVLLKEGR